MPKKNYWAHPRWRAPISYWSDPLGKFLRRSWQGKIVIMKIPKFLNGSDDDCDSCGTPLYDLNRSYSPLGHEKQRHSVPSTRRLHLDKRLLAPSIPVILSCPPPAGMFVFRPGAVEMQIPNNENHEQRAAKRVKRIRRGDRGGGVSSLGGCGATRWAGDGTLAGSGSIAALWALGRKTHRGVTTASGSRRARPSMEHSLRVGFEPKEFQSLIDAVNRELEEVTGATALSQVKYPPCRGRLPRFAVVGHQIKPCPCDALELCWTLLP